MGIIFCQTRDIIIIVLFEKCSFLGVLFFLCFRELTLTLEKSKKKHQLRLRKLEQQILDMEERHIAQVRNSL